MLMKTTESYFGKNSVIGVIYRHPTGNSHDFLETHLKAQGGERPKSQISPIFGHFVALDLLFPKCPRFSKSVKWFK